MSFNKLVNEYAIVGESVVKLTNKKPLAYWQNASGAALGIEHTKQEPTFRRRFASYFLKLLDKKMTKKFNSTFGAKQLMESTVNLVNVGDISAVGKMNWLRRYIESQSDSSNVFDGVGFDFVTQTGVTTFANGKVRIVRTEQSPYVFNLMSDTQDGSPPLVPTDTLCNIHVSFLQFGLDDPSTPVPEIALIAVEGIGMDNSFEIDLANYIMPFTVPSYETYTYVIARVEFVETNAKGKLVSYQKGKFDTLQIVGTRF